MPNPTPDRIWSFSTPNEFRTWLTANHLMESELWIKIHKKASGLKTITWEESVIEALCWGWIDGIKKALDDTSYLQRFTPRRRKSVWSKRNREHVERLIVEKRMTEFGMAHVEAAREDGRWAAAYAPASEMTVPDDFITAVNADPSSKRFFSTLNKANLYAIAYRLRTARKPETRKRRFEALLKMIANGEKLH